MSTCEGNGFNGRDRPTDQRLVYDKSTRMLGETSDV